MLKESKSSKLDDSKKLLVSFECDFKKNILKIILEITLKIILKTSLEIRFF